MPVAVGQFAQKTSLESRLEADVDLLASEFATRDRASVRRLVFDTYEQKFKAASVTEFVPLFVYQHARAQLRLDGQEISTAG
jgi:hypothetical protein